MVGVAVREVESSQVWERARLGERITRVVAAIAAATELLELEVGVRAS